MSKLLCSVTCAVAFLAALSIALPATALDIAWVSLHPADDTPSGSAATAGFLEAPDVGYTQLLAANGYNVTRLVTLNPETAPAADVENLRNALNAADLAIISRSVPSGHYISEAHREFWHGITSPMMFLGGYTNRNNRLQFMTGDTIPDTSTNTAGPVTLTATQPNHPIFAGVALDGMDSIHFADAATTPFDPFTVQRGISVVTNPPAGGGTVLATVGAADIGDSVGGALIAQWAPGAMLGNHTLAGHRMVFLTGSREHDGLTAEGAGIFDLTGDGAQLFLNAVHFMATIPEPSTAILSMLAIAGLGLLRRPRK